MASERRNPKRVFLNVRTVYRRNHTTRSPAPLRYKAEWISRGTGGQLYCSAVRASSEDVVRLARAWLARHPEYQDTTMGTYAPRCVGCGEPFTEENVRSKIRPDHHAHCDAKWTSTPACAASMGCLCAGHARGNPADAACDTREEV